MLIKKVVTKKVALSNIGVSTPFAAVFSSVTENNMDIRIIFLDITPEILKSDYNWINQL